MICVCGWPAGNHLSEQRPWIDWPEISDLECRPGEVQVSPNRVTKSGYPLNTLLRWSLTPVVRSAAKQKWPRQQSRSFVASNELSGYSCRLLPYCVCAIHLRMSPPAFGSWFPKYPPENTLPVESVTMQNETPTNESLCCKLCPPSSLRSTR